MKTHAEAASEGRTLSEGDRAAPAKDSTSQVKSTQTTPGPPPVRSISSIAALNEPKVWTSKRRRLDTDLFLVSAVVLLLLALSGFLTWLGLQKAVELWEKAVADRLYYNAERVPQDLVKAADLYQKAADRGNAGAQNTLGQLYYNGEGVPKDLGRAAGLWQKAADQGDAFALYNLGLLYEQGKGVPKDLGTARELYQKAADQGYEPANEKLKALSEPRK